MRNTWVSGLVVLASCAVFMEPFALGAQQQPTPEATALAKKVDDHYNHLSSIEAHYSEHYSGMGIDRTETGTLLLKKPGRMRWSYETDGKPTGKVFVLDGKFAWFYTPGDAQVQKTPARQLDDLRSPLRFLLGHTQLARELDGLTLSSLGSSSRLTGVPKGMTDRIKSLSLTVDASGTIQEMRLEEIDGAVTEFIFTAVRENVPVKDMDFTFNPPPGVTVVTGLPPL